MSFVAGLLQEYRYLAMFGVLLCCGLGLPIPEEVTLLASGLAVGWGEADFWLASAACVAGILVGDSIIFALGRYHGRTLMNHRATRWIFTRKRQARVRALFSRHRTKTVFAARFFAGLRMVVYAYAGQHGVSWPRFLALDLLGALLSGPTSIAIGWWAASVATRDEAEGYALRVLDTGRHWLYLTLAVVVLAVLGRWLYRRRLSRKDLVVADEAAADVVSDDSAVEPNDASRHSEAS